MIWSEGGGRRGEVAERPEGEKAGEAEEVLG